MSDKEKREGSSEWFMELIGNPSFLVGYVHGKALRLKALEEKLDVLDQLVGEGEEKLTKRVERIETKCRLGFTGHTRETNLLAARVANLERFPVIDPEPEQDEDSTACRESVGPDGTKYTTYCGYCLEHEATIKRLEEGNAMMGGNFQKMFDLKEGYRTNLTEATALLEKIENGGSENLWRFLVGVHQFLKRMEGGDGVGDSMAEPREDDRGDLADEGLLTLSESTTQGRNDLPREGGDADDGGGAKSTKRYDSTDVAEPRSIDWTCKKCKLKNIPSFEPVKKHEYCLYCGAELSELLDTPGPSVSKGSKRHADSCKTIFDPTGKIIEENSQSVGSDGSINITPSDSEGDVVERLRGFKEARPELIHDAISEIERLREQLTEAIQVALVARDSIAELDAEIESLREEIKQMDKGGKEGTSRLLAQNTKLRTALEEIRDHKPPDSEDSWDTCNQLYAIATEALKE